MDSIYLSNSVVGIEDISVIKHETCRIDQILIYIDGKARINITNL